MGMLLTLILLIPIKLFTVLSNGLVGNLISLPVPECLHFPEPGEKSYNSCALAKSLLLIVKASVFIEYTWIPFFFKVSIERYIKKIMML